MGNGSGSAASGSVGVMRFAQGAQMRKARGGDGVLRNRTSANFMALHFSFFSLGKMNILLSINFLTFQMLSNKLMG
jgi:hypothetical protein